MNTNEALLKISKDIQAMAPGEFKKIIDDRADSHKAIEACRKYVEASAEVKRLTGKIKDALQFCKGVKGTLLKWEPEEDDMTHLSAYYKCRATCDAIGDSVGNYDCTRWLADCEHCKTAAWLVGQRKEARKALGAAKRNITRIGKAVKS